MAERRMFAKTIIDSDAFLDMPLSSQALYFHLSMRADDEGFVNNPKRIQRTIGASDDDFKVLIAKNFIITFESGVIVIKHWKIHNYIRGDRIVKSKYEDERAMLSIKDNGAYTINNDLKEIPEHLSGKEIRKKAYEESSLPYSFDYKIRHAFWGKPCPICGAEMRGTVTDGIESDIHKPTIQHNIPLTKGGKHELGNISVICHQCNISIQDNITESLNADEVISVWDGLTSDGQMSVKCQSNVSIDKYSIGKDSIVKDSIDNTHADGVWDIHKHTNVENLSHFLNYEEYKNKQFFLDNMNLYESIKEWMAYKDQRKPKRDNFYVSIKTFLNIVVRNAQKYGADVVIDVINDSIGANYQGIVWDWCEKKSTNRSTGIDEVLNSLV